MEVLSFRMRAAHLPLRHVLISMRIGNEDVSPSCALLPNRANLCVPERRGKFKCFFFFGGGVRISHYLQTNAYIIFEFWPKHVAIKQTQLYVTDHCKVFFSIIETFQTKRVEFCQVIFCFSFLHSLQQTFCQWKPRLHMFTTVHFNRRWPYWFDDHSS